MDQREFEAQLRADGFQEIELQELASRPGKGRHRHLFAIRGLVLSGTFIVTQGSGPVTHWGEKRTSSRRGRSLFSSR
jgi:hypothetical protein